MRESELPAGDRTQALLAAVDRGAIDAETQLLIRQYGGEGRPEALLAMAGVFDAAAADFPVGETRVRLWARALRRRAFSEGSQPAVC